MTPKKVTQEELESLIVDGKTLANWSGGKTLSTIQKAAERMPENPKLKKGQYFLWKFTRQFFAEKDLGNGVSEGELDPAYERARVDKERADQLEIKNAGSRGELRDAEAFFMVNAQIAQQTISMMDALETRLATSLAAQFGADPTAVRSAIHTEIIAHRADMSAQFESYKKGCDDLDEPAKLSQH